MNSLKITSPSPKTLDKLVDKWTAQIVIFGLLFALVFTLFPYNFFFHDSSLIEPDALLERATKPSHLDDILLNILLFLPWGFGLTCLTHKIKLRGVVTLAIVTIASFLLSFKIEVLQIFLPARTPSPIDLLTNTTGGFLGCLCFRFWAVDILDQATAFVEKVKKMLTVKILAGAFIGYLLLTFILSIPLQNAANLWNLSNWDSSFPLLVGNERTGERSWRGKIYNLDILDRGITDAEAAQILSEPDSVTNIKNSLLASYRFVGQGSYSDQTGQTGDLVWQGKPAIAENGMGISLGSKHWLATKTPVNSLIQKIVESSQFTFSAVVAAAETEQHGPARIISISKDAYSRNLTLGQRGSDLVLRLRTPLTGNNGRFPELVVPNVFADTNPHHILLTYCNSVVKFYVDKVQNAGSFGLTPEAALFYYFSPSAGSIRLSADNTRFYKVLYYASIFIPLGLILGVILSIWRGQFVFHLFWLCGGIILPALILEGLLASVNARSIYLHNILIPIAITLGTILLMQLRKTLATKAIN